MLELRLKGVEISQEKKIEGRVTKFLASVPCHFYLSLQYWWMIKPDTFRWPFK